ncbi:MAG TPA: tetratricopeptide repeat protein [Xanthobacteraceae bacterium]|nr:tetratricopeptide repeat protein [Xanthobacteraceae bacterium]
MRTYDRLIAVALLAAGLGLTSAIAFEGTGARDGAAPTVNAAPVPPGAVTAPALAPASPAMPVPSLAPPSSPGGTIPGAMRAPDLKRGLTPGDRLTPAEAFRSGTQALQAGDIKTGLRALEYAAQNGHAIAQWKLGRMYADGDQVRRDDVRAFEYFHDMVDNHPDDSLGTPQARFVANAFVALGSYYLTGITDSPVKANPQRARDLFSYAASYFGDADAQYRLGRMLLEGQGGPKDPWQAARWLKLAADKGYYQAQALLGVTLLKGNGIPRQVSRGLMYLTIARDTAPQDKTVADLHAAAFAQASDEDRALALAYLESWLKGRRE